ncbi:hypothetical protein ACZ76_02695 [Yersinia aleksiciae]|uniref:Uncharacterized protein n=1 Tax=Yersinia aleksiciae TaxID=263819 RepID=A0ABM5UAD9_YERAE|nr:hypothetical protein ACZ76_02695 [Yersinia aleksiciae]
MRVGAVGINSSSNRPKEKMANSNSTGGEAKRDLAVSSQGVGASFKSARVCDADIGRRFFVNACRLAMRCVIQTSMTRQARQRNHLAARCLLTIIRV